MSENNEVFFILWKSNSWSGEYATREAADNALSEYMDKLNLTERAGQVVQGSKFKVKYLNVLETE